jgi:hypothetical protein
LDTQSYLLIAKMMKGSKAALSKLADDWHITHGVKRYQ